MFIAIKEEKRNYKIKGFSTFEKAYQYAIINKWDAVTDGFGKVIKKVE